MPLSCSGKFYCLLLIVCNLPIFVLLFDYFAMVTGGVMTGFGIHLMIESNKFNMTGSAYAMINTYLVIGILVFVTSLLGYCGAWKKNKCFLQLFAAAVSVIIIAEIACGIALATNTDQFEPFIQKYFTDAIEEIEATGNSSSLNAIKQIQESLDCCGANAPNDWTQPSKYCCNDGQSACDPLQKPGCVGKICYELKEFIVGIGIFVIVLALVGIGAIVAALALASHMAS